MSDSVFLSCFVFYHNFWSIWLIWVHGYLLIILIQFCFGSFWLIWVDGYMLIVLALYYFYWEFWFILIRLVLVDDSLIDSMKMLGNDDLKSKNEKGSDGGEYNSHTSAARPIASEVMSAKESCLESGNPGGISNGESLAEKNSKDDEFVKSDDSSPSNMAAVKETGSKSAAEDSTNSVKTAASVSEVEKSNTRSVFLENSVAALQEVIDLAGKMNEDSVYPSTNENAKTLSFEEPNPKESDIKVLTPSSASPLNKFTNGAVHTKNSETPKSSKNQVWHLPLYTCFIA